MISRLSQAKVVLWARNHPQLTGIILLSGALFLVFSIRLFHFRWNSAPSGSDGGQWLAFAHQLFGEEKVRAGFESYPPLFPFLVRVVSQGDGLLTLKLLGVFTSVFISVPAYLLLRTALYPAVAAVLATAAALTPYQSEVLSFGGYPQLLGSSFLLLAIFFLLYGLKTGWNRWFLLASLFNAGVAGSNIIPASMMIGATVVILLLWYITQRRGGSAFPIRIRSLMLYWAAPSALLWLPFYGIYRDYFVSVKQAGISQRYFPLTDIIYWLSGGWRWEFAMWLAIFIVFALVMLLTFRKVLNEQPALAIASFAVLLCGLVGVLFLGELRFSSFVEIGLVLASGVLASRVVPVLSNPESRQRHLTIALAALFITVSVIGLMGYRRFMIAYNWYTVVDNTAMDGLVWLRENRVPGAKVAATNSKHGHIYGWWIEGFAHMPTLMVGDARLFVGAKEHDQVALARRLLLENIEAEVIRDIADREQIHFLFIDTDVIQHSINNFTRAGFVEVFQKGRIIVMSREPQ